MKFSLKDITKIIDIVSKNQFVFIASNLGSQYLSKTNKVLLRSFGIKLDKIKGKVSDVERSFYFGMFSQYLGGLKSFKASSEDFEKYLKKQLSQPRNIKREAALEHIKNRAFVDLSGLGNRISNRISNKIIASSMKQQNILRGKVKKKSIEAIKKNKSQGQLASELREITQDWAKDFSKISNYVIQESYAFGRAQYLFEEYGDEVEVWKQTFPGVCEPCRKNYGDPGKEPKVFKLKDLLSNGDNIGRKTQIPVAGPAHPWARSILRLKPTNSVWSDSKKDFVITRNNQGVKRRNKVNISVEP